MRRAMMLLMVFVLIWAAGGCGDKNPEDPPFIDKDFRKGTDGLSIEFIKGAPPDEVFEESGFFAGVKVWNMGAYDISEGYLTLGIETDYMCLLEEGGAECPKEKIVYQDDLGENMIFGEVVEPSTKPSIKLEPARLGGRSISSPSGNYQILQYALHSRPIERTSNAHSSLLYAKLCYSYRTVVIENVCIDPDPLGINPGQKSCTPSDITLADQGSPVAVTKVEVEMLPAGQGAARPQFLIYLKNKGNGRVVAKDKVAAACGNDKVTSRDWSYVTLDHFGLSNRYSYRFSESSGPGGTEFDCRPNPVKLEALEDSMIRCTLEPGLAITEGDANDAYTTQIQLELSYGYTTSISKSIQINKVKTY